MHAGRPDGLRRTGFRIHRRIARTGGPGHADGGSDAGDADDPLDARGTAAAGGELDAGGDAAPADALPMWPARLA